MKSKTVKVGLEEIKKQMSIPDGRGILYHRDGIDVSAGAVTYCYTYDRRRCPSCPARQSPDLDTICAGCTAPKDDPWEVAINSTIGRDII